MALQNAKETGSRVLPDKIYHVEKAVIAKDHQLEIYIEGSLSNTTHRSQFTVGIPLDQVRHAVEQTIKYGTNSVICSDIKVGRSAIHPAWPPQDENAVVVPIGEPISTPYSGSGIDYMYYAFGEDAKLLPGSTKTLYPIVERTGGPAALQFMYVDASCRQKYAIIRVDQMVVPNGPNLFYYVVLPITVPFDIVTAPIQIPFLLLIYSAMGHNC